MSAGVEGWTPHLRMGLPRAPARPADGGSNPGPPPGFEALEVIWVISEVIWVILEVFWVILEVKTLETLQKPRPDPLNLQNL